MHVQTGLSDGWQQEQPDNWLPPSGPPGKFHGRTRKSGFNLNCSYEVRGGRLRAIVGKPSSLIGVPYDRPVVGYGGKTINTLAALGGESDRLLRLGRIQPRRVRGCSGRGPRSRIHYTSTVSGRLHHHRARSTFSCRSISGGLLAGRPHPALSPWQRRLERTSRQSRHPDERYAPGHGGAGADADSA